jgi:hypothetical protein
VLSERERRLELLLQRVEAQRVQPRSLGGGPRRLGQTQQRRAAPEGKRLGEGLRGSACVAGSEGGARSNEQLLGLDGVHPCALERVPVGGQPDPVGAQRATQPRHVVLHGVSRCRRELASPQRLDQRVGRHDPTWPQRQAGNEGLPLRARHVNGPPGHDHLERPEEPNLELSHAGCHSFRGVWHATEGL